MRKKLLRSLPVIIAVAIGAIAWKTAKDLRPVPQTFFRADTPYEKAQVVDRFGTPLSITYQNRFNVHSVLSVHEIPEFLQQAFIEAEDQRFFSHHGVDWRARFAAVVQNLRAGRIIRGASTITEQVVRMIHPRPRSFWSRWLEGFEAVNLEKEVSKPEILEFYLNQVPYARRRRGVLQAAHLYFDRDLSTLNRKEMLALAVLVRAPSRLDPLKGTGAIEKPLRRLALRLRHNAALSEEQFEEIMHTELKLKQPEPPVEAAHFVQFVLTEDTRKLPQGKLRTTLDAELQGKVKKTLEARLQALRGRLVDDGAALVVENESGSVRAWVNAGGMSDEPGSQYDVVTLKRQPGSTLKPFLYALALESGWTAATLIKDAPLEQAVGMGLHGYRNYSGKFYGPLRLRQALGNSLNSPAVRTVGSVGRSGFVERLRTLGFDSLREHADFYGDGIALGNAEVSLYELVRAYTVFARKGTFRPLAHTVATAQGFRPTRQVFSKEVSSLIADILSDPEARRLEFGGGLLHLPIQTAVKTGTSNDYRDAWAVGFSSRYTVGVWMGNLDRKPMLGVSGSIGPAYVLRSIFAQLEGQEGGASLYLSPRLLSAQICPLTGKRSGPNCSSVEEWFRPEHMPVEYCSDHLHPGTDNHSASESAQVPKLVLPTAGLHLAMDPRIPDAMEAFPFEVSTPPEFRRAQWVLNGKAIAATNSPKYHWNLQRGTHRLYARIWLKNNPSPLRTREIKFLVK